jgi:mRNA interferase RelE/StbE
MVISKTAQKQLRKMQKQDAQRLIIALKEYDLSGEGDVKKLKGRNGYRLRTGNMRAIFEIVEGMIVLQAGYRGNIY